MNRTLRYFAIFGALVFTALLPLDASAQAGSQRPGAGGSANATSIVPMNQRRALKRVK